VELTLAAAKEWLASLGLSIPDPVLQLLVDQINAVDDCLTANGVPVGTALLMKYYILALLGVTQGNKYITQQRAPSGASQSYAFGTLANGYAQYSGLLRGLDKYGCFTDIIPDDPTAANCAFFIGKPNDGCC
jgi:hypothetical protein